MNEIPPVEPSGADGSQTIGVALTPVPIVPPMQVISIPLHSNVPEAIEGLVVTHSRNLGGDVSARLIAASMRDTSNQLAAANEAIEKKDSELSELRNNVSDLRVDKAKLEASIQAIIGNNRIKQACTFIGTALLGVAVDLYKDDLTNAAYVIGFLGVAALIFVILPFFEGGSK